MSIKFAVNQLVDSLARHMRWLILWFKWYNEPATLAAADTFFGSNSGILLFLRVTKGGWVASVGCQSNISSLK